MERNYRAIITIFTAGLVTFGVGMCYLPEPPPRAPEGMTAGEYSDYRTSFVVNSIPFKVVISGAGVCLLVLLYICIPRCYSEWQENYGGVLPVTYIAPVARVAPLGRVAPVGSVAPVGRVASLTAPNEVQLEKHVRPILKVTPQLSSQEAPSSSPPAQLVRKA